MRVWGEYDVACGHDVQELFSDFVKAESSFGISASLASGSFAEIGIVKECGHRIDEGP